MANKGKALSFLLVKNEETGLWDVTASVRDTKTLGSLAGATVTIPGIGSKSTSQSGFCQCKDVPPGTYLATAEAEGYLTKTLTLELAEYLPNLP